MHFDIFLYGLTEEIALVNIKEYIEQPTDYCYLSFFVLVV